MNSNKKFSLFSNFFNLQKFWTDGSKIHSIFHTSWNSFNMMISFGMSSQEITKLNLHYFPGRRCFDGLFPESGNKAGTIKSLWNADLISREMARKTTCRRNGRSIREGEMECRERKFPLPKLFKKDGDWEQWCSRKTELQSHNSTRQLNNKFYPELPPEEIISESPRWLCEYLWIFASRCLSSLLVTPRKQPHKSEVERSQVPRHKSARPPERTCVPEEASFLAAARGQLGGWGAGGGAQGRGPRLLLAASRAPPPNPGRRREGRGVGCLSTWRRRRHLCRFQARSPLRQLPSTPQPRAPLCGNRSCGGQLSRLSDARLERRSAGRAEGGSGSCHEGGSGG